ncbi:ATP-binding protein [Streptomyces phytohabitans]|uniref:HAMP domain-containing sensor histidine kinase n=1 Tax=Streptomyces phytohabitans TaxID=1150371 RepID=UPI00345BB9F3
MRGLVRETANWRSLRWRIALLVAVSCCAIALTVGLLVHRSTYERSMNDGAARAYSALEGALDSGDEDGVLAYGAGEMPPELARRLRSADEAHLYDESRAYRPRMWAGRRLDGGRLVAIPVDMVPDQLSRRALDRHMVKYSLLALAVIVPLAALAAELPNRRLRRVARTAGRITAGDLGARTGAGGRAGDEITDIAATVDSMADSLQGRLVSEQRFTADVAHELRTPLMGLVTSAGLLPEGEATDLVRDRVGVLRGLVEDLLEVSRLDADAERADLRRVPLGEVVADAVARLGFPVELTVEGAPLVETDPRRLDRIVVNLVTNAHRHGAAPDGTRAGEAPRVSVEVRDGVVSVRDRGPGFPAVLLAEGPQRFRTGAAERGRGHGLGLTIATGQARVIGAELTLANAPEGGAVATLRLPGDGPGAPVDRG